LFFFEKVLRSEFEELVGDLLDAAVAPLARLLKGKPTVDAVEVLGGSVRIPALQDRLRAQLKSSLGRDVPLGRCAIHDLSDLPT
jgi:heat shock protein 4